MVEELKISECLSSHDEENPIKSVATVKHQIVRSPGNFSKLKCNTDLNIPPSNWLSSSFNSYGLQQALSQATGFSSFRMAHLFSDCLGEVDVVSNAENIKRLLKLPYASNCSISMMVHRIGSTLLIDDFDIHRFLLQQEDCNWKWLKSFICEHFTRLNEQERNVPNKQSTRNDSMHQRSLLSKFLYHSISSTTTATISDSKDTVNVDFEPKYLQEGPLLPEPNVEDVPDPKHTKHTYNRNVIWQLNNTKMLIGTDLPIFGGVGGISLRLRDMDKPINVLTGIDYWLDNLMCNVPEIGMCYHLNGFVQKYEIIKTEDLPFLENSQFSPNVIRNVAQNILSFLKQNATKSGHTYWLFKGHKDDVVKLYDLTSEFETSSQFDESDHQSKKEDPDKKTFEKDDKNPFTIPVAMLLYKVAKNMKNSTDRIEAKRAGSIKALLENCLKLLPKEQYPQIVTSSYYLLSDLYVPTGIDPISPNFNNEIEDSETDVCDSDDSGSNSVEDEQQVHGGVGENIAIQSIVDATKETQKNENNFHPPPLTGDIEERCSNALQYIFKGLNCLQYFLINEEKLSKEKEEIKKQAEKIRIIQEELNPNMAKRYQAIPLPYEEIKNDKINKTSDTKCDQQMLLEKCQTSTSSSSSSSSSVVIGSWNTHLKLLLIEKSCLVYATLTEQEYQHGKYGSALKFISIAMKCYKIVSKQVSNFLSIGSNYQTNLLARAGDCYFQCVQNFTSIEEYISQFQSLRDIDLAIKDELHKDLVQLDMEMDIESPTNNLEKSISCYEIALQCADGKGSRNELLSRIGSVLNELAVRYMGWSQAEFEKRSSEASVQNSASLSTKDGEFDDNAELSEKPEPLYMSLARKSYENFIRGISIFEEVNDNSNLAILLCNLGRFMRFRAHLQDDKEFCFKKICYENAFTSYQRALTILESKKQNSQLWDLVSWELSSGKFTLAKLIQQHFQNEMNDKIEQELIDLLMGSLKLCDTQTRSARKIMYTVRSGLIYQCLGNIYIDSYKKKGCSNARRKKLLNLCRLYYGKSINVFKQLDGIDNYLGVQIDRLELQNTLFEGHHAAAQKCKTLHTALEIACESIEQFKKTHESDDNQYDHVNLLKQFELLLQTTLKHLIQISITKNSDNPEITTLKQLYSFTLQSNINRNDFMLFSKYLLKTLETIKEALF
ncbi:erythroid differentiation-related factor 1 isoform X2 [Sitodiplosis mosellana]|uniref:erythroid differentiation-related factor 1 isoform X2 n=1 Tax=Sitodiplosis mosellana TaxID=263140 RepID=UPI002443C3AC|nr:erythroid differentiation-related factor 1 isoform X2 [Sitodiplosis mosellana]